MNSDNEKKYMGNLTFDSDNLAVPEIHTHEEKVEIADRKAEEKEAEEEAKKEMESSIFFDNVAIPEYHVRKKEQ